MKDLTGNKYGKLLVVEKAKKRSGGNYFWICACDCGDFSVVRGTYLVQGHTKSCGCMRKESLRDVANVHGKSGSRIYRIWQNMRRRCYNENFVSYPNYGMRGIEVCDEWRNDFLVFYDWAMANGYRDDLTLDRINNDGPYSPENCRWATVKEQSNNKRDTLYFSCCGTTDTLANWARKVGVPYNRLYYLLRCGRDGEVEKILKAGGGNEKTHI